jgi:hypothetical protein
MNEIAVDQQFHFLCFISLVLRGLKLNLLWIIQGDT